MTIRLKKGGSVPIVISEKEVERQPEIIRKGRWLGYKTGLLNLVKRAKIKVAELIHESFFEETYEVVDPGVVTETHYALQIGNDGHGPSLVVEEVPYMPHCAHHYEIIKVTTPEEREAQEELTKTATRDPNSPFTGYQTERPRPRRIRS